MAVGDATFGDDAVMTSPDGETWTVQSAAGNDDDWQSVAYGNGLFVAVADETSTGDNVMTSPDGETWTVQSAVGDDDAWKGITYSKDDGRFVAVGGTSGDRTMYADLNALQLTTASAVSDVSGNYSVILPEITSTTSLTVYVNNSPSTKATTLTLPNDSLYLNDIDLYEDTVRIQHASTTGNIDLSTAETFYDVSDDDNILLDVDGTTTYIGSSTRLTDFEIANNTTFTPTNDLVLWGDFVQNGSFRTGAGTTTFNGTNAVATGTFTGLDALGDVTFNATTTLHTASTSNISIVSGAELGIAEMLDISGELTSAGSLANSGVVRFSDTSSLTLESSAAANLGEVEIAGTAVFNDSATTSDLSVLSGGDFTPGSVLEVRGNFSQNGSVDFSGTELFMAVGSTSISGTLIGSSALGDVVIGSTTEKGVAGESGTGDGEIAMTAGVFSGAYFGYGDGSSGSPFGASFGTLSNTSGLTINSLYSFNDSGWQNVLIVPDTSPTLNTILVDGTSYTLTPSGTSGGFDLYAFEPGTQLIFDTIEYDITVTTSGSVVYGGGGSSLGSADTVTIANAIEVDNLQITRNRALALSDTLTITNNYANYGQLNASTSAVVLGGLSVQTATGTLSSASAFYDLTISNTSEDGDTSQSVVFGAPLEVTNNFTMNPGTSAAFLADATSTLENIDLLGTSGNEIYLRSTSDGQVWGLDIPGTQLSVDFVNVQDSAASSTITANNSFDSGNNTNWTFETSTSTADIEFIGSLSASGTSSAATVDLNGLSLQEDDLVLVLNFISSDADINAGVTTAGYTEASEQYFDQSGGVTPQDTNSSISYKVMASSPDSTVECAGTGGSPGVSLCAVQVFRGVDVSNPMDVTPVEFVTGTDTIDPPAITPVTEGALIVAAGGIAGRQYALTPPTGFTNQLNFESIEASYSATAALSSKTWSSGSEDPDAYSAVAGGIVNPSASAVTLALRPATIDPPLQQGTGSSTIAEHAAGQIDNAFNFMNKTNEELFAFSLQSNSGVATATALTLDLSVVEDVDPTDFSNIRLLLDSDSDAEYDVTDVVLVSDGQIAIDTETESGTITFDESFAFNSLADYLVVADWNAPDRSAHIFISLSAEDVTTLDITGLQTVFGAVDLVQHTRTERRGGGGVSFDIGGSAPSGSGVVAGGDSGGGRDLEAGSGSGDRLELELNYHAPSADSGDWVEGSNAYDQTDGTFASVTDVSSGISYVGGATAANTSGARDYNVDLTGIAMQEDDIVIAVNFFEDSRDNPNGIQTAGYVEIHDIYLSSVRFNYGMSYKIMGPVPDTVLECSANTRGGISVCIVQVYRGVNITTPLDVTSTSITSTSEAPPNPPTITPVTDGAWVVAAGASGQRNGDTIVTAPAGYANHTQVSQEDTTDAIIAAMADKPWAGGSENPAAWTDWATDTGMESVAVTLALRPAGTTVSAHTFQDHGFAVNSGANIDGVEVKLETSGTLGVGAVDVDLSWDGGSTWTSSQSTPTLSASDAVISLGGPSDLWGRSWSVGDFSDANFRVRLTGLPVANTVRVDEIQVRVYSQITGGSSGGGADI